MKPYDPQLRAAIEEIKPILKKYDCMGMVALASPTHSEFLFEPNATWSLLKWEGVEAPDQIKALRLRSKREDFPSLEAQKFATESTIHAIESIKWLTARFHDDLSKLMTLVRTKMTVMTNIAGLMGTPDSYPGDGK